MGEKNRNLTFFRDTVPKSVIQNLVLRKKKGGVAVVIKFVWKMLCISLRDFSIDVRTSKVLTSPAVKKTV